MSLDVDNELNASELGTQTYWNDAYKAEIENFKETGDIGEIWFGEDSMIRVIQWLLKCDSVNFEDTIIDIGCGNGITLLELAREGYKHLLGVDYSQPAIELATGVCKEEFPSIEYKVLDIVNDNMTEYIGKFKVAHDKGTYDAISLCPEDAKNKRENYIEKVHKILKDDGIFIITSCNWTNHELTQHFKEYFCVKEIIPTPQFKFGGKVGNVVTSIVYLKANKENI